MDKIYVLEDCKIRINLSFGMIKVYSNLELWRFLVDDKEYRMNLLVEKIKTEYKHIYGLPLKIKDESLIVEILAHVYCDYLGLLFNRIVKIKPVQNVMKKLLKRAEIADCGEKDKDNNRWLWDSLIYFKSFFLKIIPQKMYLTGLKKY